MKYMAVVFMEPMNVNIVLLMKIKFGLMDGGRVFAVQKNRYNVKIGNLMEAGAI